MTHLWNPIRPLKVYPMDIRARDFCADWEEFLDKLLANNIYKYLDWSWIPSANKILETQPSLSDRVRKVLGISLRFDLMEVFQKFGESGVFDYSDPSYSQILTAITQRKELGLFKFPGYGNDRDLSRIFNEREMPLFLDQDYFLLDVGQNDGDETLSLFYIVFVNDSDEPKVKEFLNKTFRTEISQVNNAFTYPALSNPLMESRIVGRALDKYFIPDLSDSILRYLI